MRKLLLAAMLAAGCGAAAPGVEKGEGWMEIDCTGAGSRVSTAGDAYYLVYSRLVPFDEPLAVNIVAQMCDITRLECDGQTLSEECTSLQAVDLSVEGQLSTVCEYGQNAPVGSNDCRGTKSRAAGYVRITWD